MPQGGTLVPLRHPPLPNCQFSNSQPPRLEPILTPRKQTSATSSNSQLWPLCGIGFLEPPTTLRQPPGPYNPSLAPRPSSPAPVFQHRLTPPETGCYSPLFAPTRGIALIHRGLNWIVLLALLSSFASGCSVSHRTTVKPGEAPGPLMTATRSDLIARYNSQSAAVTSLNATVSMKLTAGSAYSGVIENYHEVNGFILASVSASIRVIGQAPVVGKNIFDMVSDGKTFSIFVPSKNKFLVGPADLNRPAKKPIENLRPQHLVDALIWSPIRTGTTVLFEEANEASGRYYVLTTISGGMGSFEAGGLGSSPGLQILRKIWFDRSDLNVARLESYAPGGEVNSDVHYSDWQSAIERPGDDYKLEITIKKLALNESIAPDRFILQQPPGTELVRVGEDSSEPQSAEPKPLEPKQ
jgi:outer membrane lipoprotein-sorting protein